MRLSPTSPPPTLSVHMQDYVILVYVIGLLRLATLLYWKQKKTRKKLVINFLHDVKYMCQAGSVFFVSCVKLPVLNNYH